jgi:hypothetical protein
LILSSRPLQALDVYRIMTARLRLMVIRYDLCHCQTGGEIQ